MSPVLRLVEARTKQLPELIRRTSDVDWGAPGRVLRAELDAVAHGNNNLNARVTLWLEDGRRCRRRLRVELGERSTFKEREFMALQTLDGLVGVPDVYSYQADPPRIVTSWAEPLRPVPPFAAPGRRAFLDECVELYRALHGVRVPPRMTRAPFDPEPRDALEELTRKLWQRLERDGANTAEERLALHHLQAVQVAAGASTRRPPVILQESPTRSNVGIHHGRPYFVDWDTVRVGDRERDLAAFLLLQTEDREEARYFVRHASSDPVRLAAHLMPVLLWKHLSGTLELTESRIRGCVVLAGELLARR